MTELKVIANVVNHTYFCVQETSMTEKERITNKSRHQRLSQMQKHAEVFPCHRNYHCLVLLMIEGFPSGKVLCQAVEKPTNYTYF